MTFYDRKMDGTGGGASDFEIFNNVMVLHNAVKDYAEEVRKRGKLPKENLPSIAGHIAEKEGLLVYKGLYVKPETEIPDKIKKIIDERN